MKIPFSPPDITEAEIEQVAEALRSGWITTGPKTKELEREVADLCGTNRAVCLNSQTACAEMTLRLLGIHEGDEVITCAYTYTASASVAVSYTHLDVYKRQAFPLFLPVYFQCEKRSAAPMRMRQTGRKKQ